MVAFMRDVLFSSNDGHNRKRKIRGNREIPSDFFVRVSLAEQRNAGVRRGRGGRGGEGEDHIVGRRVEENAFLSLLFFSALACAPSRAVSPKQPRERILADEGTNSSPPSSSSSSSLTHPAR